MEQGPIDYKKTRAKIQLACGIELDDTTIAVLTVIVSDLKRNFAEQNKELRAATEKISSSQKSLQVDTQNPKTQAFWFGMGKWGMALLFTVGITSLFLVYYIHFQQENDTRSVQLQWYGKYYELTLDSNRKDVLNFLKNNPFPQGQ